MRAFTCPVLQIIDNKKTNFYDMHNFFPAGNPNYKIIFLYTSRLLLLALVYFACARMGLAFPYVGSHITLIWLPTGVAVAAMLSWGLSYWPGIFLGAIASNFFIDASPLLDIGIAIGNTLGPLLTTVLLRQLKFNGALERAIDILGLIATAALGMLVSASGGVISLMLARVLTVQDAGLAWLSWWGGDVVGVLLAVPPLINISRDTLKKLTQQKIEFIVWACITLALSWGVFFLNNDAYNHSLPLVFILLPLIVWSAMRFGVMGSSLAVLLPILVAALATNLGLGPFRISVAHQGLLLLWLFIATMVLVNLIVAVLQRGRITSEAKVQRLIKLYAALTHCNQAIMHCESEEELFPQVCRDAVEIGGFKMAWVGLLDQQNKRVIPVAVFGAGVEYLQGIQISVDTSDPTGISIRENRPVWCQDFQHDPSTALWHKRAASVGWAASASLPLQRNGITVGAFMLYTSEVNAFDEPARNLLLEMTTDISYALSKFALLSERREAEYAMRIAAVTFDTHDGIMITDPNGKILRVNQAFIDTTGYSAAEVIGQNPRMLQSGRHDAAFYQAMWSTILNTGKWNGEIWDKRKNGEIYPQSTNITAIRDNKQKITHYVNVSRDITHLKKSEEEIHQLAFYDQLTGLPNRRLLLDRLQQAIATSMRNSRHSALLFLDLDHFKNINDTQGHSMGDQLLIEVAHRLQNCVREGDTVARLGGDEFVIVLEGLSSEVDEAASLTELVAEKVRLELGRPYVLNAYECLSTVSIGISLFLGHQENMESLLQHADVALYQAKTAGRNAIRFFDPHMQTALDIRAAMETDLRHALDKQQFRLHYQIQVDNLRRPLGAEALLRWEHPERGLVSPMDFIPLAEETGLIVPIGLWVLKAACTQLSKWQNDALTRDLTLAVNVSAKQFRHVDFVTQIQHVLVDSGAKPSRLKLELTESTVLENVEDTIQKMRDIKTLGASFSMDDFGTGYSSLQYLKRLPLNQIKIDQSFVRDIATDPNDAAIVQTIIAMTEALGLDVIAEGVETEAQLEFIELCGCHAFQGYLFSKPVPLDKFEDLLRVGKPSRKKQLSAD